MTWIPLLLADPSPCLRYLVLKDLLNRNENDDEVLELSRLMQEDQFVKELVSLQKPSGAWDTFNINRYSSKDNLYITSLVLQRLGYLGFKADFPPIQKGIEYLFSKQEDDGSWPMPNKNLLIDEELGYQMMPIQTAIPLLGIVMCGCAEDKRAEQAYEWLIEQRLNDGAWPVGISAGNYGGIAGYRRLAHSKWGCRSNTTTVLTCFAYHPTRRKDDESTRALDLILGTTTKLRSIMGFTIARLLGLERSIGMITFMARFDIAHLLNLCWRIEASSDDERIFEFIEFVKKEKGPYGLWDYHNDPRATKWLTYDLLKSLTSLRENSDWISLEPSTSFQSYPKKIRRY